MQRTMPHTEDDPGELGTQKTRKSELTEEEEARMLFENVDRFEEIPEVYGVFPLRENFLEAGNAALKEYGLEARIVDNVIRIPFVDRLLFSEDEYDFYGVDDDENADMKDWRIRAEACITLNGDPEEGIRGVYCDYEFDTYEGDDWSYETYSPREEEYDRAYDLIEIFLNKAVDAA